MSTHRPAEPVSLVPVATAEGWGVRLEGHKARYEQLRPVAAVNRELDAVGIARAYSELTARDGGLVGFGWAPLGHDARLAVVDTWTMHDGEVEVARVATVHGSGPGGFTSRLTLRREDRQAGWTDVEPFIPGVTYGNAPRVASGALGGWPARRDGAQVVLIREDRMAAPMVACRYDDGQWLGLMHLDPGTAQTIAADCIEIDGDDILVDHRLGFVSLGGVAVDHGLELGAWFPGTEGEYTYSSGGLPLSQPRAWRYRYHPIQDGLEQRYRLAIRIGASTSFPEMCTGTWRWAWDRLGPRAVTSDIGAALRSTIAVLSAQVREVGGRTGVPLEADAVMTNPSGEDTRAVMGFVGANTTAAGLLLRVGARFGGAEGARLQTQGAAILDSFCQIPLDPPAAEGFDTVTGQPTTYRTVRGVPAVYARALTEGCAAALSAGLWDGRRGVIRDGWIRWATAGGDWLIGQQRPDGSIPRAWEAGSGSVLDPSASATYVVVPFLISLWRATGDLRYRTAGLRAGEHAWQEDGPTGSFAGGTLDNPDVVDKEASILAAEAFLALREATGEEAWLQRAVTAASVAETWIYLWDVPMPLDAPDPALHWKRGVPTTGHQLITTGASMSDGFLAVNAATFARLWVATGDEHWLAVARLVTHGTKAMLALDGRSFDLRGPGWQQEHWCFGGRRGYGLNRRWLPWVAVAHVGGIIGLEDLGGDVAAAVLGQGLGG